MSLNAHQSARARPTEPARGAGPPPFAPSTKVSYAAIPAASHGAPSTITFEIPKETLMTNKNSLTFRSRNNVVLIEEVSHWTTWQAQPRETLVPGLRVLKVCGHDVTSALECVKHIHAALTRDISIVTEGKLIAPERIRHNDGKASTTDKEIALKQKNKNYVQVAWVNPYGMFRDLDVGQILIGIQGIRIKTVEEASSMLQEYYLPRLLVVDDVNRFNDQSSTGGSTAATQRTSVNSGTGVISSPSVYRGNALNSITWVIQKEEKPTASLDGLAFRSCNKRVIVDGVGLETKNKSELVPGLRVLKVCGHDVTSALECVKHIHAAPTGDISIVTEGRFIATERMCYNNGKKFRSNKEAGIGIEKLPNQEYVQVTWVNPYGMFWALQLGQILYSINGIKINNVKEASSLLRKKNWLRLVMVDVRTAKDPFGLLCENDQSRNTGSKAVSQWFVLKDGFEFSPVTARYRS